MQPIWMCHPPAETLIWTDSKYREAQAAGTQIESALDHHHTYLFLLGAGIIDVQSFPQEHGQYKAVCKII